MSYGIPVSINPDDPGFFNVIGVSFDYYLLAVGQEFGKIKNFLKFFQKRPQRFQTLHLEQCLP